MEEGGGGGQTWTGKITLSGGVTSRGGVRWSERSVEDAVGRGKAHLRNVSMSIDRESQARRARVCEPSQIDRLV